MKTLHIAWLLAIPLLSLKARAQPIEPEVLCHFPRPPAKPNAGLTLAATGIFRKRHDQRGWK